MKPIIGITAGSDPNGDIFLRRQYGEAVRRSGGVPVILPFIGDPRTASQFCDGIIFSGGGDITKECCTYDRYDEALIFEPDSRRDIFELELARLAYEKDIPTLGICRGLQIMNTSRGGSLRFDIPGHKQKLPRNTPSHPISVAPASLLYRLLVTHEAKVNSFHHQSADSVGDGLTAVAAAEDGTVEAIEAANKRFWLGVQWHPEHMDNDDAHTIFRELCEAGKNRTR